MLSTFLPQTTFLALALVSLTSAGPITSRDDQLATFCWSDESCFQASAVPAGCVDLPLFSQNFTTASLSAPGLECILSPERECLGNTGFTGILFDSAGTVASKPPPSRTAARMPPGSVRRLQASL
ncbi:hypothetical protein B0H12DRAFT_316666 [Mycena haematopus]|nr:hypothetical protein B0H12DRAFT_316666 [Mycena haematopus]